MKRRILVTDKVHPLLLSGLKESGFDVNYTPDVSYAQVRERIHAFNGIIINSKVICNRFFLEQSSHLDFIGRLGSGLDIIDLDAARQLGIEIISSPEGNANAVGEHSLGMLLGLTSRIISASQQTRNGIWRREENRGRELYQKKVGIIGFGHTGPAFAEKLNGFGVQILVYDKYRNDIGEFHNVEEADLVTLISQCDIISIHLPLTHETRNLVNAAFLSKVKKGAIIINTSRGLILNSSDLLMALENGQISGACLDVLENEKPDTWTEEERLIYTRLMQHDNVIITPHVAGWTFRSLELIAQILLSKIVKYYKQ